MRNLEGSNCDGHEYSKKMGKELIKSLIYLSKKSEIYFPKWFSKQIDCENYFFWKKIIEDNNLIINYIEPFNILLTYPFNLENENLLNFYLSIKKSNNNKILIGPDRLFGAKDSLKISHHIKIPLINAYNSFDNIYKDVENFIENDLIILMCVGMMSPILSKNLLQLNLKLTILDFGSGLDPIFYGNTRHGQSSTTEVKNYFKKIL